MGYGNRSFQHINESEKRQILSLYKKMDLEGIFEVKNKVDNKELISDFGKSLGIQKKYLSALFLNLPVNESIVILNNIKEDSVKNLFGENRVVLENYHTNYNNLLTEETTDLFSELNRFHKFLNESLSTELDRLNEQLAITKWLDYATKYIVKTGVGRFMESLRSALFSGVGTAIQILASITGPATLGIGPAIVTGIWCIMGLYDLYQISQGVDGAWGNFIIDVICALTAGSLGGKLSKFIGTAGKTLTQALQNLMTKGLGSYITPIITLIQKATTSVARWFTWGGQFAKKNLGINWLSDKVAPAMKYMDDLVVKLREKIIPKDSGVKTPLGAAGYITGKKITSLVPSNTLRKTGALASKINPDVWGKLSNLSAKEVGTIAGQTLEKGVFKAIEKEIKSRFKEKPTQEVLKWIDGKFGTAYSDVYLAYLGGTKLFKYKGGKYTSAVENTANAIRGQANYSASQTEKIKQAVSSVSGEKPTSADIAKQSTTKKPVG
jgi:hypothetical protein